ncbi:hypothetical protein CIPAW_09G086000 [Carya illinoinensis]|uniref:Gnk2-homologous domain-containing protein n=2 Tax=Carya illinoinensis TaxID=32201 RepID=A0A8T1PFC4_CARIL|nr:hypothetical protein CIPAW_09G086000 [Carya illinoinensis]
MLGSLSLTTHAADLVPLSHFCANSTFSQNSLYNSSLNSLLSSLSDPVYGLFLCRGDVTSLMCRTCVAAATKEFAAKCSREKVAVIWYDECMIRYSNEFFSTMALRPKIHLGNTQNITEQDRFNGLVHTTMTDLANRASNFPIGVKKFGTNQTNFSEFQNLYSFVQCTPDLSSVDCNWCLQRAINRFPICCGGKQGGRVLFPSCNVRYELFPFYSESMCKIIQRMQVLKVPFLSLFPCITFWHHADQSLNSIREHQLYFEIKTTIDVYPTHIRYH